MSIITTWVMQIIIFILIATIVDLMIPANNMKKYIHLVFGLLLLLIFTKPLLYLFSLDMESEIRKVETIMYENNEQTFISKNQIQTQKSEIQADQNAYILKEVRDSLMSKANPVLMDKYNVEIVAIQLHFIDENMDNYEHLQDITVTIHSLQENDETSDIETVGIDTEAIGQKNDELIDTEEIRTQLESIWGLPKDQIIVFWEGGAN